MNSERQRAGTGRDIFFEYFYFQNSTKNGNKVKKGPGFVKGHPPSADLRYGEEDSISPSTLIFATRKG